MLSRSFFAGVQRYSSVWTGDTKGDWEHLQLSVSVLQNLCTCGVNFCGSDIPGFFGDPPNELIVRWYQVGAFFPLMRAHAHHMTKRREPWLFSEDILKLVSQAVRTRYELLPYIYTTFYQFSYSRSWPIMMPLWMAFKHTGAAGMAGLEEEFMFGPSLLVRAVCSAEYELYVLRCFILRRLKVYLPPGDIWYDFQGFKMTPGGQEVGYNVADLSSFPVFIRGGSILPRYVFYFRRDTGVEL